MIPAAIFGVVILCLMAVFQTLLIVGRPLGDYAWGGQHKILPKKFRIASIFSIVLYVIFVVFILAKAGLVQTAITNPAIDVGMWMITGYFFLGLFVNFISRNKKERLVMTPVALILALSFLTVANGI